MAKRGPLLVNGLDVRLDLRSLRVRQPLDLRVQIAQAVVDVTPRSIEDIAACLSKTSL